MTKALMKRPCVALMRIPKIRWVMLNPGVADPSDPTLRVLCSSLPDPEAFRLSAHGPELDEILDQVGRAFEWEPPRSWEVS